MSKTSTNNIIFDLDGVLITTSLAKASWYIGPITIGRSLIKGSLSDIEFGYFNFLAELKPWVDTSVLVMSVRGNRLPCLMVDYQSGLIDSRHIIQIIDHALKDKKYSKDRDLYYAMTQLIFNPIVFINCYKPIRSVVNILKRCKKARNKDGSLKNRLFLLTNFDEESFYCIIHHPHFKSLLALFDGIIASGVVHAIKPEYAIFDRLFTTYAIDPVNQLTVYIDDNIQNINAAQSFFPLMHSIHFKRKACTNLEANLKQLSIL